jgi:hypothetical protein
MTLFLVWPVCNRCATEETMELSMSLEGMAGTTRLELATSAVTECFFVKIASSHEAAFKFTSTNSRSIRPRCQRTMVSEWPTIHELARFVITSAFVGTNPMHE